MQPDSFIKRWRSTTWVMTKDKWGRAWYRFRRNPISIIGAIMVLFFLFMAILAPFAAPYPEHWGSYTNMRNAFQPPSADHWFGTNTLGGDLFSRILFASRMSFMLAVVVLGVSMPVGIVLGLVSGYLGVKTEIIIMRITDIFLAIPALVMALAITAAFTPTIERAMLAVAAVWWTWPCRLVNSIARSVKNESFVQSSKLLGASHLRIMFKDILPNCASPIIVKITLDAGFVILVGAGLSFLGLGAQPPAEDLGTMISIGSKYLPERWWMTVYPSVWLFFIILGFNLLGDGLRDALAVEEGV